MKRIEAYLDVDQFAQTPSDGAKIGKVNYSLTEKSKFPLVHKGKFDFSVREKLTVPILAPSDGV